MQAVEVALGRGGLYEAEFRTVLPDGETRSLGERGRVLQDHRGRPIRIVGIVQGITDRKAAEEALLLQALHDPLTGLPNRILFRERVDQALAQRAAGKAAARCPIDPDTEPQLPLDQPRHDGPTIVMSSGPTFEPADVTVHIGATVTWLNTETVAHTTSDEPATAFDANAESLPLDGTPWNSGALEPGDSYSVVLDETGEYVYVWRLHQPDEIVGHITVVDDGDEAQQITDSGG